MRAAANTANVPVTMAVKVMRSPVEAVAAPLVVLVPAGVGMGTSAVVGAPVGVTIVGLAVSSFPVGAEGAVLADVGLAEGSRVINEPLEALVGVAVSAAGGIPIWSKGAVVGV